MRVREVLGRFIHDETILDEAENDILYNCEDCTYIEEEEEEPEPEPKRPEPTLEDILTTVECLPLAERLRVLEELRKRK